MAVLIMIFINFGRGFISSADFHGRWHAKRDGRSLFMRVALGVPFYPNNPTRLNRFFSFLP